MFKFVPVSSVSENDTLTKTIYRFQGDPEGQVRVLDEPFTAFRERQLKISAAKGKYKIETILSTR